MIKTIIEVVIIINITNTAKNKSLDKLLLWVCIWSYYMKVKATSIAIKHEIVLICLAFGTPNTKLSN